MKLAVIYDSGKRYILDFEVVIKTLNLKPEEIDKLKAAALKEIAKL